MVNVGEYSIHGSYGYWKSPEYFMRQCHGLDTLLLAWAIGAPLIWRNQNKFGERKQRSRIKQFRNTLDDIKSGQVLWRTSLSKSNLHAKFFLHSIPYRTCEFLLEETLLRTGQQSQTNLLDLEHGAHLMGPNGAFCTKSEDPSTHESEKTLGTTNVLTGFTPLSVFQIPKEWLPWSF